MKPRYPRSIIRQNGDSFEGRAVGQAAMLLDVPVLRSSADELVKHRDALVAGAMPVGSVEFVRLAMAVANIPEPAPLSYPAVLKGFLKRDVREMSLGGLAGTLFVKPVETKLFTGFVFREGADAASYSEHDQEQLAVLRGLPPSTRVWASEPVKFESEWRYYVVDGKLLASARYDQDGPDYPRMPDGQACIDAAVAMAREADAPAGYSLDVGVLESGETALVEVNDGWALGLYGQSLTPKEYLGLLTARWEQIHGLAMQPAKGVAETRRARP